MEYYDPHVTVTYERNYLLSELKSRQVSSKTPLENLDTEELLILFAEESIKDLEDDKH